MSTADRVNALLSALKNLFSADADNYFVADKTFTDAGDAPNFQEIKSTYMRLRSSSAVDRRSNRFASAPLATVNNMLGVSAGCG